MQGFAVPGRSGQAGGEQPRSGAQAGRRPVPAQMPAASSTVVARPRASPMAVPEQHGEEDQQEHHAEADEERGQDGVEEEAAGRSFSSLSSTANSSSRVWSVARPESARAPQGLAEARGRGSLMRRLAAVDQQAQQEADAGGDADGLPGVVVT